MLFFLAGSLLIASLLVLFLRKSKESIYLLGMCVSLLLQLSGILIFIAKKGGYSREVMDFLFFSPQVKSWVQYRLITLNAMGYLIALGRYLFPTFLLLMAMHYSMLPLLRRHAYAKYTVLILPLFSLVIYFPAVYRLVVKDWPFLQDLIVQFSYFWILLYVVLAMFLLVYEYFAITMRFYRRQFSLIAVCMLALSGLYVLYCGQDPGQVYRFYSYDYIWSRGIGYMQYSPSVFGYFMIVAVNVVCGVLGFTALFRYTQNVFLSDHDEVTMERKFDIARSGASVFVHSIKNQLLANRVLYKRAYQELEKPEADLEHVRELMNSLRDNNEQLIKRFEELYRTVKSKSVLLVPTSLGQVAETTVDRFAQKYPEGRVQVSVDESTEVLADLNYFSEALYNLLCNGWEANLAADREDSPVMLLSFEERLYTVLEVRDCGVGIKREDHKKIFEPFYSSKNSNYNWGMGLYHVRAIVKSHLGTLRLESEPGKGTSFFILLPKYGQTAKTSKRKGIV